MHNLALVIKTFKPDYERVKLLIESIDKHNSDNIPVYISINDADYDFFKSKLTNTKHTLLKDSQICTTSVTDGWRYQQIVKSQFYKLKVAKNYLCLDSDSLFISSFYIKDFIYKGDTPYTIMQESKPQLEIFERIGVDTVEHSFRTPVKAIRAIFNLPEVKYWDYGPSPYLWSCKVWESFYEDYLPENNFTIETFFNELDKTTHPAEALIYGEYLRKTKIIDIIPCECFFKVYHYKKQFDIEKKFHDIDKLKKVYLGVIFQSNWTQKKKRFKLF